MVLSCSKKTVNIIIRGVTSKHHSDFYCRSCFHSFAAEKKRESHKKGCGNKDFYNKIMPSEDTKILELDQYQKSDKVRFIIYLDLE